MCVRHGLINLEARNRQRGSAFASRAARKRRRTFSAAHNRQLKRRRHRRRDRHKPDISRARTSQSTRIANCRGTELSAKRMKRNISLAQRKTPLPIHAPLFSLVFCAFNQNTNKAFLQIIQVYSKAQ